MSFFDEFNEMPQDVQWVTLLCASGGTGGIVMGSAAYNEAKRIVLENPKYFPWEAKYNSIPKEVHEAYLDEKYPDRHLPLTLSNDGLTGFQGLIPTIKNQLSEPIKEFTFENMDAFFAEQRKRVIETSKEKMARDKKDKALWDKYYKKYGLEWGGGLFV